MNSDRKTCEKLKKHSNDKDRYQKYRALVSNSAVGGGLHLAPCWGHLGILSVHLRPSWAILRFSLTHLWAILGYWKLSWGPRAVYIFGWESPCPDLAVLGILGASLREPIIVFLFLGGAIVWTSFWIVFEIRLVQFWGLFWDLIGPRRGQDELKTAIKSFEDPKTFTCRIEVV